MGTLRIHGDSSRMMGYIFEILYGMHWETPYLSRGLGTVSLQAQGFAFELLQASDFNEPAHDAKLPQCDTASALGFKVLGGGS